MLHEHVPGEDLIASAWEHKDDQDNGSPHDESDWEERLEKVGGDSALLPKLSASYISGLNYRDDPPGFKTHTLHSGVVVQRRADGGLIVGMKNGWVGKIPCISIKRGVQLISGNKPPEIGEDVTVLVHKITHFPQENAFAISSVLKKGDVFDVIIDSIDVIKRRVSLSIAPNPEAVASCNDFVVIPSTHQNEDFD